MLKQSQRKWETHPMAKLTDYEVRLLLTLRQFEGVSMRRLAKMFKVSVASVFNYVHGIYRV